tara:strand:+ start:1572 stop:2087 length:516 start_codon:yes stop_codon:yes gene_type:complete
MANRIFANVASTNPTADTDSTRKGATVGASDQFMMYQTATATDVELLSSGTEYLYCGGPDETDDTSAFYIAWADSNLTNLGADGNNKFVSFWGCAADASDTIKLATLNAAGVTIRGINSELVSTIEGCGFPFTSGTALDAALNINGISGAGSGNGIKLACIVISNGTVVVS